MIAQPARRRFTVDEYECMVEAGVLHPEDHVELIEGEILQMAPIGSRHAAYLDILAATFILRLAGRAIVRNQNPVRLTPRSEPEPDLAIVVPRGDGYAHGHPGPADVLLLIEVSDTTLAYDRDVKLPLYARAGIPEVWIADLGGERVLVYREPAIAGYEQHFVVERDGVLAPQAFPDLLLTVADFLPPAAP